MLESELSNPINLQHQITPILNILDKLATQSVAEGATPSALISTGDRSKVKSHCESFATPNIARSIGHALRRDIRSVVSNHIKPVQTHMFMEDQNTGELIDPVAITFLIIPAEVALQYKDVVMGTMFVGTREQLHALIMNPGVQITNCSSAADKELSFQRIWGSKSKQYGLEDSEVDKFYSHHEE